MNSLYKNFLILALLSVKLIGASEIQEDDLMEHASAFGNFMPDLNGEYEEAYTGTRYFNTLQANGLNEYQLGDSILTQDYSIPSDMTMTTINASNLERPLNGGQKRKLNNLKETFFASEPDTHEMSPKRVNTRKPKKNNLTRRNLNSASAAAVLPQLSSINLSLNMISSQPAASNIHSDSDGRNSPGSVKSATSSRYSGYNSCDCLIKAPRAEGVEVRSESEYGSESDSEYKKKSRMIADISEDIDF